MLVVDTNILIYAADADSPWHVACRDWLDRQRRTAEAWYSTWPIFYEFLRVTTHPRVMRRPWTLQQSWGFLQVVTLSPGFELLLPTPRHAEVLGGLVTQTPHLTGNIAHDLATVALMREHGIGRIATRDADFLRFPGLSVFDPAAPKVHDRP